MAKFLCLNEVTDCVDGLSEIEECPLLLNTDEIVSIERSGSSSIESYITLKNGANYTVRETVKAVMLKLERLKFARADLAETNSAPVG